MIKALPEFKEFVDDKGRILVQIEKALYGLVQSDKLWFDTLAGVLNRNGFKCNLIDPCVFNKTVNGDQITVVVYVEDLLITCKCISEINKVKCLIEKEFIDIKVKEGSEFTYLGMSIKRYDNGSISVDMRAYIESILKEWSDKEYRDYAMPADEDLFDVDDASKPSKKEKLFHRVVAQLLYLCKRGRPDVALTVNFLCTRVKNPTEQDESKLVRLLGYLGGTINRLRIISKDGKMEHVEAHIDASFSAHPDGKGQSGCEIFVGTTLVDVITRKH